MLKKKRVITFANSINEALVQSMLRDKNVLLIGLGVDDPKGIFGTTLNIQKKFPHHRVFDMPTSENSFTGFSIGLAIEGKKPVITHQRVEFSLLSFEQIVNQAAKWFYMSGGQKNISLVIRLIIGKGWGQGPQHSQSLESVFAHIPGLKVVCPSSPADAKGLLISSIEDKNPVIFFEHRWLHHTKGAVKKKYYKVPIGESRYLRKGDDLTIITYSYMVVECLRASKVLEDNNISCDIIDLRTLRPLDEKKFLKSAQKTKKVLIVDNGWKKYGIGSEISAIIFEKLNKSKISIDRIGIVDSPIPSTIALASFAYPNQELIIRKIEKLLKTKIIIKSKFAIKGSPDQPYPDFAGPF